MAALIGTKTMCMDGSNIKWAIYTVNGDGLKLAKPSVWSFNAILRKTTVYNKMNVFSLDE